MTNIITKKFVEDWPQLFKAYSFIFHVLSALLTLIEIILPWMGFIEPFFTPTTYGLIMFCLNVAGGVGRLMKQRGLGDV